MSLCLRMRGVSRTHMGNTMGMHAIFRAPPSANLKNGVCGVMVALRTVNSAARDRYSPFTQELTLFRKSIVLHKDKYTKLCIGFIV